MPETLTLKNQAMPVRPLVVHLLHHEVCVPRGICSCHTVAVGVARRGSKGQRTFAVERRRLPRTITLGARGTDSATVAELPVEVLHAADVKRLVAARALVATREQTAPAAPETSAPPASTGTPTSAPEEHG